MDVCILFICLKLLWVPTSKLLDEFPHDFLQKDPNFLEKVYKSQKVWLKLILFINNLT